MAYQGPSTFNGQGGTGGKGKGKSISGFNQTTTFIEPVWDEKMQERNTTSVKKTTVSDGKSALKGIRTPC